MVARHAALAHLARVEVLVRSLRGGRPYVEAFPALALAEVIAAYGAGYRTTEWTSERGLVIGHAEITGLTAGKVKVRHAFFGTPNVERSSGEAAIDITDRTSSDTQCSELLLLYLRTYSRQRLLRHEQMGVQKVS